MNHWLNKIAVVTGSASGIGSAITKELLNANINVIGLDINVKNLNNLKSSLPLNKKDLFNIKQCDIRNTDEVKNIFKEITKNYGNGPDILINSAGLLKHGNLIEMNLNAIRETLDTQIIGTINCTREAIHIMKENDIKGHIIMLNSINGHRIPTFLGKTVPTTNIYTPSKYAITAMVEVLRQELLNIESDIKITSISPGLTETPIVPTFLLDNPNIARLQPKDVADCVIFALSTPPHVQVHELIVLPLRGIF